MYKPANQRIGELTSQLMVVIGYIESQIARMVRSYLLFALLALTACARPVPLLRPNGVAVAPDGSVYVMDRGNYRVVHFGAEGKSLGTFGQFGDKPENIHTGWDMAIDSAGNIYICHFSFSANGDLTHDGIKVFSPDGAFLREIGRMDYDINQDFTPHKPYGLDIDVEDRVYVADFDTNTLRIFDAQGQSLVPNRVDSCISSKDFPCRDVQNKSGLSGLGTFFGEVGAEAGQFRGINDVAVDDTRGLLYLSDSTNSRVQQFTLAYSGDNIPALTYRDSFGEYGSGPGQLAYPQGLAVDEATGRLYVADHANRRVQAFDPEGIVVASFAPPDIRIWQVLLLTVGPDGDVYVTDGYNNVIWVFTSEGILHKRIEVVQ